ncbi:MAG: hypothetical protein ACRCWR_02030 [Saezia sp.]
MRIFTKLSIVVAATLAVSGCFNLPTPSEQITGSYVSEQKYVSFTCEALATELGSLARRENQLVTAQDTRRSGSMAQAFWVGVGNGDGLEASELANVRGEKEAVRRAIDQRCSNTSAPAENKL